MQLSEILSALPPQVELVAVSKFQSIEKMVALYQNGQKKFGENYVQELTEKAAQLKERGIQDIEFHFIGKLQRNKVKALVPHVQVIHSVDSLPLLLEIEKHAVVMQKKIRVYGQINIDREESKSGFDPDEVSQYAEGLKDLNWVSSVGLMCIPNPESKSQDAFARMKKISEQWKHIVGAGLSMGMSSDYEIAIQYGSTCVRIGTALFGERDGRT